MDVFPAFFPLKGAVVVIVGDGEGADAKARLLEGSPAEIRRVSGEAAFRPETYQGALLAFIADGEDADLKAAADLARAAGVLVNVTDRPALCDFTTPAVIDRGAWSQLSAPAAARRPWRPAFAMTLSRRCRRAQAAPPPCWPDFRDR